jgi:hypothetical protein
MANIVKLNKKFLAGGFEVGIEITPPPTDSEVAAAFANNTAFPYKQIDLGKISAKAEGSHDLKFGDGMGQVVFKGSASAFAGLGVYPDADKLLAALSVEDNIALGLNLENDENSLYLALRWGYDVKASAEGSIALGAPASITFGASGEKEALYAVIRQLDKGTGAVTAIEETVQSWMLPSQINQLDDLEPGTWLIAEVNGSIALSLGVQYGYNFNWVHEAKLLGLSGDIGLKLKADISAALNFSSQGNFAVVIERRKSSDQNLRFRIFRLRKKGWGFAFNAGASVQGDFNDFLPEFDEFVKAIFGVHGAQVLSSLKAVEKWTDPDVTLGELLSGAGVDYAEDIFEKVAGIDPADAIEVVKEKLGKLVDLLNKWNDLPHDVTTRIWKLVEKNEDLAKIRAIAREIVEANVDTIEKPIADLLSDVDFFTTPVGKWLEAAAANGIFNALNSTHEFEALQKVARQTLAVLDGSELEKVLEKLQKHIEDHLNLGQLFPGLDKLGDLFGIDNLKDLDQASFDDLDKWLKARLADFLNKEIAALNLQDINAIRKSIFLVIKRGRSFYDKTLKALNHKNDFNFAYTYQSTTTKTALLDFTLTGTDGISALKLALKGRYDELLTTQMPGVKLNVATLTHQIERHSHVEINLPWVKTATDHINTSLAKVDAVDNDGGRLFVYELSAKDIVEEKNKRLSSLSIGGFLEAPTNQVRIHSLDELTYSYTFRQVKKAMRRSDLQYQLKPTISTYLGEVFNATGAQGYDTWIGDLDKQVDALEPNGTDNFGKTLVGLNLSLPARAVSAWNNAPAEPGNQIKVPIYLNMSRRLQRKMRETLTLYHFQDLDHYETPDVAASLLVYSAIPPSTSIKYDGTTLTINRDEDYFWDFIDEDKLKAMVLSPLTQANLSPTLERTYNLLREAGRTGTAEFFKPNRVQRIQETVAFSSDHRQRLFSLLYVENEIIKAARRAGFEIAKFVKLDDSKPSEAVKALANFGSKLSAAFNEKVKSIYGGDALRMLGTALFIEAAAAIGGTSSVVPTAMLELIVLRQAAAFDISKYLAGEAPEKADVLVAQRIVNIP